MEFLRERQQVLETAQEIAESQLVVGTSGNVSLMIAGQDLLLITPSGMDYRSMTVEDLILLNSSGEIVAGKWKASVETPMHLNIYQHRKDVQAIVHVHSPYASAFAVAYQPIPVVLEETAQIIGHEIKLAPYAICGSNQLAENTIQTLGGGNAVLLANHGLVAVAHGLADALKICYTAEKTAKVVLDAKILGEVHSLPAEDIQQLRKGFASYGQKKNEA
jgi:L-fuculose-phosphate aldolase